MKTITLNSGLVALFERKLITFKKKFNKFGTTQFIYEKSEPYYVSDNQNKFYKQVVVDINIDAVYNIAGYEFVASLTWDDEVKQNIIKKVSEDVFVPQEFRTTTKCDHCGVNRYRKHTIILKNISTGKYVQIGKSCCKDYLGQDISDYASYLSLSTTLDDYIESITKDGFRSGKCIMAFTPEEVLLQTIESVKKHGYISKAIAQENGEDSTSTKIYFAMNNITDPYNNMRYPKFTVSEESKQYLNEILSYLKEADDTSDYVNNLKIVAQKEYITNDNLGLVVSIVGWYLRSVAQKKEREQTINSEYIGTVGDKITFSGIPTCITSYETQFGITYIYTFVQDNNVIIWKTNKGLEDEVITLKGTIKGHQEYKGIKQTEVTRCRQI